MSRLLGRSIFPGWFVVAACFVVTASLGEAFYSFGVFFKPLEDEFGWSRSLISSGYTLFILGYAVSTALGGRLADRYGSRRVLLPSSCLAGLGIALCSQLNSVEQLRLFLCIAGLGAGASFSVPTATVQRWFRHRKSSGTALAIVVAGTGAGALVFTPLVNSFILDYGWRSAYLITGIIFFVLTFVASLAIRPSPVEMAVPSAGGGIARPVGFTTVQAVTSLPYLGIFYAYCIAAVGFNTVATHLVPHAIDLNIPSTAAAAALGLMGGLSIPGRLLSGFVGGRIAWQKVTAFSMFGMAAAIAWLMFLDSAWMLYGFVFLFGTFHGMRVVALLGIQGEFFGMRSLGELIGISSGASNLVSAAAPYIAGYVFDVTGSYLAAFGIMAALIAAGGLVIMLVKRPPLPAQ